MQAEFKKKIRNAVFSAQFQRKSSLLGAATCQKSIPSRLNKKHSAGFCVAIRMVKLSFWWQRDRFETSSLMEG